MRSSYTTSDLNYGDILRVIQLTLKPSEIVEFGILYGFSLRIWAESDARVRAYDIFSDFNGNHAEYDVMGDYKDYDNVRIDYGDFHSKHIEFQDKSLDLLHIDIANNGDTYRYAERHYFNKIRDGGVVILEGGSVERDRVEWMNKYDKTPISPVVTEWRNQGYDVVTIGTMPSVTIVKI